MINKSSRKIHSLTQTCLSHPSADRCGTENLVRKVRQALRQISIVSPGLELVAKPQFKEACRTVCRCGLLTARHQGASLTTPTVDIHIWEFCHQLWKFFLIVAE
jgi:hypothetical protein